MLCNNTKMWNVDVKKLLTSWNFLTSGSCLDGNRRPAKYLVKVIILTQPWRLPNPSQVLFVPKPKQISIRVLSHYETQLVCATCTIKKQCVQISQEFHKPRVPLWTRLYWSFNNLTADQAKTSWQHSFITIMYSSEAVRLMHTLRSDLTQNIRGTIK